MYNVIGMWVIKKGFTLIELLVTIGVLSVLAAAIISLTGPGPRQYARDTKRKADLEQIRSALELYRNSNTSYIVSTTGAPVPTILPTLVPSYIQSLPPDPTSGRQYYYSGTATTYNLCASLEKWTGLTPTPEAGCINPPANCGTGCNYKVIQP